jgi:hypothetical protein
MGVDIVDADQELETQVWRESSRDTIMIKVRMWLRDANGNRHKKGVIMEISDELLQDVAEGAEYPRVSPQFIGPEFVPYLRRPRE